MWKRINSLLKRGPSPALPNGATIAVVGGGPAGSFFAIETLRKARRLGKDLNLLILEKKKEVPSDRSSHLSGLREGCNYCAGGISARLVRVLDEMDIHLPEEIVSSRAHSVTVHGDWKSIELPIPPGRKMFSVFRGSRPRRRSNRYSNFDSFLLDQAVREGAEVITAQVLKIHYGSEAKPILTYRSDLGRSGETITLETDFAVFACGVNQKPGQPPDQSALFESLQQVLPGYRPPRVRQALICEMQGKAELIQQMEGEVHFALYGSKELQIEMSSLIPKERWITIALLGPTIDEAPRSENRRIMERFLELPHIQRLLPRNVLIPPACMCTPNMAVGVARNPFGDRVALIGDMVVSRLYKDGIFSAYVTGSALSKCILSDGIDQDSLKKRYRKAIRRIHWDNVLGRVVFFLNRVSFAHPVLSRIIYQAVLSERKGQPKNKRRLADVMWRVASGDDSYGRILASMFHPKTARLILLGGLMVTFRNYLTESIFGLRWRDFGRYPTGVPRERVEEKRREIRTIMEVQNAEDPLDFERMYAIKIKAPPSKIMAQLAKLGDRDRQYLKQRFVDLRRTSGKANQAGCTIQYDIYPRLLSFSVVLEHVDENRYLLYRVRNGFADGGVLAFDVRRSKKGVSLLSIYVGFDFPKPRAPVKRLTWRLFGLCFPKFVHDVAWNHALCKIKHLVECARAE